MEYKDMTLGELVEEVIKTHDQVAMLWSKVNRIEKDVAGK